MCLTKPPFFGDRAGTSITAAVETALGSLLLCGALTLVVDSGVGGAEDRGDGCAHVQLCQRQLIHEIWELMEGNHTGMVTAAWHLPWGLENGTRLPRVL